MGATYLMSYPGRTFGARPASGAASAQSNPRAAFAEWLTVADAVTRAGGHILVLPPPVDDPGGAQSGLVGAGHAGAMFKNGDEWQFIIANPKDPARKPEAAHLRQFLVSAGVPSRDAQKTWGGQADVLPLKAARFLLCWGGSSSQESVEEIRAALPRGARSLDVQLQPTVAHGGECLAPLSNRALDMHLLVFGGALVNRTVPELRSYVGNYVEVIAIDEDDVRARATSALSVNGALLLPRGTSTGLRGALIKRGYLVEELELPELLGKAGLGPRALVNELPGFVLTDGAPSYALRREELYRLLETYPESVPASAAPAAPPATPAM